jgi:hypothetical protein
MVQEEGWLRLAGPITAASVPKGYKAERHLVRKRGLAQPEYVLAAEQFRLSGAVSAIRSGVMSGGGLPARGGPDLTCVRRCGTSPAEPVPRPGANNLEARQSRRGGPVERRGMKVGAASRSLGSPALGGRRSRSSAAAAISSKGTRTVDSGTGSRCAIGMSL